MKWCSLNQTSSRGFFPLFDSFVKHWKPKFFQLWATASSNLFWTWEGEKYFPFYSTQFPHPIKEIKFDWLSSQNQAFIRCLEELPKTNTTTLIAWYQHCWLSSMGEAPLVVDHTRVLFHLHQVVTATLYFCRQLTGKHGPSHYQSPIGSCQEQSPPWVLRQPQWRVIIEVRAQFLPPLGMFLLLGRGPPSLVISPF